MRAHARACVCVCFRYAYMDRVSRAKRIQAYAGIPIPGVCRAYLKSGSVLSGLMLSHIFSREGIQEGAR